MTDDSVKILDDLDTAIGATLRARMSIEPTVMIPPPIDTLDFKLSSEDRFIEARTRFKQAITDGDQLAAEEAFHASSAVALDVGWAVGVHGRGLLKVRPYINQRQPYESNGEFMDDCLILLDLRCQRLASQGKAVVWMKNPPSEDKVMDLWIAEMTHTSKVEARLAAHREAKGCPLPLDDLRREQGLDDDEILILAALGLAALSHGIAQRALDHLGITPVSPSVEDMITLVDPEGLDTRLRWRRYFEGEGSLMTGGFIRLAVELDEDVPGNNQILGVELTSRGFEAVWGPREARQP
ncbi:MAG: hypothetical protein ACE366_24700 [Bradymonadia bacterium]